MKFNDLAKPIAQAKNTLAALRGKYPGLDAYLVFASPLGQASISDVSSELLNCFPDFFRDLPARKAALAVLSKLKKEQAMLGDLKAKARKIDDPHVIESAAKVAELTAKLKPMTDELDIEESVQIELRFGELRLDLVKNIQSDPLVDQTLTPQSVASIRIVLGSLVQMAGGRHGD